MSYLQPKDNSLRWMGSGLVAASHLLLLYALLKGFTQRVIEPAQTPLMARIMSSAPTTQVNSPAAPMPLPKPVAVPLPIAKPEPIVTPPKPVVIAKPKPKVAIKKPSLTKVTPAVITPVLIKMAPTVAPTQAAPSVQSVVPAPVRTRPLVKANACAKPRYPRASLRANEAGIVKLKFLVGADGRVIESKIERSSGYARLDEAAREALSLCSFKPATLDGRAVPDWALLQYEWKID